MAEHATNSTNDSKLSILLRIPRRSGTSPNSTSHSTIFFTTRQTMSLLRTHWRHRYVPVLISMSTRSLTESDPLKKLNVVNKSMELPAYKYYKNASDPNLFPRLDAVYDFLNATQNVSLTLAGVIDHFINTTFVRSPSTIYIFENVLMQFDFTARNGDKPHRFIQSHAGVCWERHYVGLWGFKAR